MAREFRSKNQHEEFEQKIVDLARITRVVAGGKRLRFRALVVIGDRRGQVGEGVAKARDVAGAIAKATAKARKNLITVPLINETIPFEAREKYKAAKILIKPAVKGVGLKVGGPMRIVLELAGVKNAVGKIFGSNNKINNVRATLKALERMNELAN